MHYASSIGFDTVLKQIRSYADEDPVLWDISPHLVELASSSQEQSSG